MNFFTYLGIDPATFALQYLETDLVQVQHHDTLPLDIFCYGRKAVKEDHWDKVTTRCRGHVVNRLTGEIVARPFEKFHNYGSTAAETADPLYAVNLTEHPVIWEKLDGFLCTAYTFEGKRMLPRRVRSIAFTRSGQPPSTTAT